MSLLEDLQNGHQLYKDTPNPVKDLLWEAQKAFKEFLNKRRNVSVHMRYEGSNTYAFIISVGNPGYDSIGKLFEVWVMGSPTIQRIVFTQVHRDIQKEFDTFEEFEEFLHEKFSSLSFMTDIMNFINYEKF